MTSQSRIQTVMASAMLLLFSHGVSAVEKCAMEGEQPLEFRFFTDNNSWKDNGWVLECDYENGHKELVWEVPIGSIKSQTRTEVIREAACIPDSATCYLNIFDGSGDGLQGNKNGDPSTNSFAGWFAFLHGATTIATYKEIEEQKFSELSYCVGPKCDKESQEVRANDEDCQEMVYLAMQLDNSPEDISYQLICGGESEGTFDKKVYWDGKGFTEAGAYIEEETCLPKDACCEFIVVDSKSNGLTDAVEGGNTDGPNQQTGFIYLETNYAPVLQYDGKDGETFGVLTKRFGCDEKIDRTVDKEEIVAEEAINVPKDDEEEVVTTDEDEDEDKDKDEGKNKDEGKGKDKEKDSSKNEDVSKESGSTEASQDKEEEEQQGESKDEEMDVEVGDNVPGVAHEVLPDQTTQQLIKDYFGNKNGFQTDYPSIEYSWIDTGEHTVPPTSKNWVSDDDYQNSNDDGKGFGEFTGNFQGGFTDDIVTVMPSETSTIPPTSFNTEHEAWDLWDDVVEDDDISSWPNMEEDFMGEMEELIHQVDANSPKLPSDPNASLLLNGEPAYADRKKMRKAHKITIALLTVVFVLWSAGLALWYFREQLAERLSAITGSKEAIDGENSLGKAGDETISGTGSLASEENV